MVCQHPQLVSSRIPDAGSGTHTSWNLIFNTSLVPSEVRTGSASSTRAHQGLGAASDLYIIMSTCTISL